MAVVDASEGRLRRLAVPTIGVHLSSTGAQVAAVVGDVVRVPLG